ncbi:MAG TPA: DUF1844 domain-containing protein [Planctomycetota bacterium]|nr:DUF1844 domain-containing protein [Planctomycetota bacterium]
MADQSEEIPAFRFVEKKVDDSWKEEVRREREAAAAKAAAATPRAPAPQPEAPPEAPEAPEAPAAPAAAKKAAEAQEKPKASGSPQEQQQTKIFMTFLTGLAQQALMQLGEMENPYTGQAELDLQGARYTIELLNTIAVKTKGNLSSEEEQSLTATIQELKMRYVEITNEVQRQMAAQMQKGGNRPGPGGTIPGPGFGRR